MLMTTEKEIIDELRAISGALRTTIRYYEGLQVGGVPMRDPAEETLQSIRRALGGQISLPTSMKDVRGEIDDCERCALCRERKNIVLGEGCEEADLVFIGEGPGRDEDIEGRPFIGKAGELLTKIIENAMGFKRCEAYITNIVKCRPPKNRDPEADEVAACHPYLLKQLAVIRPRVIVALGRPATSTLLGKPAKISRIRGQWQAFHGIPFMPTFHPAYVLRNYDRKTRGLVFDDMKQVVRALKES